jgi:hypothetical protein
MPPAPTATVKIEHTDPKIKHGGTIGTGNVTVTAKVKVSKLKDTSNPVKVWARIQRVRPTPAPLLQAKDGPKDIKDGNQDTFAFDLVGVAKDDHYHLIVETCDDNGSSVNQITLIGG